MSKTWQEVPLRFSGEIQMSLHGQRISIAMELPDGMGIKRINWLDVYCEPGESCKQGGVELKIEDGKLWARKLLQT